MGAGGTHGLRHRQLGVMAVAHPASLCREGCPARRPAWLRQARAGCRSGGRTHPPIPEMGGPPPFSGPPAHYRNVSPPRPFNRGEWGGGWRLLTGGYAGPTSAAPELGGGQGGVGVGHSVKMLFGAIA